MLLHSLLGSAAAAAPHVAAGLASSGIPGMLLTDALLLATTGGADNEQLVRPLLPCLADPALSGLPA